MDIRRLVCVVQGGEAPRLGARPHPAAPGPQAPSAPVDITFRDWWDLPKPRGPAGVGPAGQ